MPSIQDGKFHIVTLLGQDHQKNEVKVEVALLREELDKVLRNLRKQGEEVRMQFDSAQFRRATEKQPPPANEG